MRSALKGLIYSFFIVFPFGYLLRYHLAPNVSVNLMDGAVLLLGLAGLLNFEIVKKAFIENKFFRFQVLFITAGFVSLLINVLLYKDINIATAALYSIRYFALVLLLPTGSMISKINVRRLFLFSGALFLVFGLLQYLFVYDLRPFTYLGWDDHLYRLFSTFLDPNFAGLYYVIFFFFLLFDISKRNFKKSYIQIFLAFFTFVAVYLTYSRSAMLALACGLVTLLILRGKTKFIFFTILLLVFFLFLFKDSTIEGSNPLRTLSSSNRIASLNQASSIFVKNPVIGVGYDSFLYAQLRYSTRSLAGTMKSHADAGTDNSLMFVLATTGFVGFTFFIISYLKLSKELINENDFGKYLLSIIVSLFVGSMFINALFYMPIISWLFILISFRKRIAIDDM